MKEPLPLYFYILVGLGLLALNIAVYRNIFSTPVLEIQVFTVGKGTVALIKTPDRKSLLVDTGSDASILRAVGGALPMWQKHIDAIILTSTESKSVGGLKQVQNRYQTPPPLIFGIKIPYGGILTFDRVVRVKVISPHLFTLSYGISSLFVSSTTPVGKYLSDGTSIQK
jgi:hypothetical protein